MKEEVISGDKVREIIKQFQEQEGIEKDDEDK
jgi:hypothetical protein